MDPNTERIIQESALNSAALLVAMWPTILDGIEGMVQQTMARNFTEREARAIVATSLAGRATG